MKQADEYLLKISNIIGEATDSLKVIVRTLLDDTCGRLDFVEYNIRAITHAEIDEHRPEFNEIIRNVFIDKDNEMRFGVVVDGWLSNNYEIEPEELDFKDLLKVLRGFEEALDEVTLSK